MFQRKKTDLPTSMSLPTGDGGGGGGGFSFTGGNSGPDGSGKAIKMDAPVVKAWKKSSGYTKGSYYALLFFILMLFWGYRYMRYWNASIWLTCHTEQCTLELTPPGSRTKTIVVSRAQLVSAHAIKTDKSGNFISFDTSKYEVPNRKKGGKKNYSYKGPDENGHYSSYAIKFKISTKGDEEKSDGSVVETKPPVDAIPDGDFTPGLKYLTKDEDGEHYMLYMRQFGLSQSRTRIRSNINKIESYVRKRRQKLILKESATLAWQGIVCLIFGLLGIMLTLLAGQFWDEPPRRQGGPGTRRSAPNVVKRGGAEPSFFVDTGRPSKYPPGMKKY